jgi:hypothetical protein
MSPESLWRSLTPERLSFWIPLANSQRVFATYRKPRRSQPVRLSGCESRSQVTLRSLPCTGAMSPMECTANLRKAIEGLYTAFSNYPLPKFTDPCLHCHSLDDEAKLRAAPLREIDPDHLRDYAVDALLVWGDVLVFKHFLPRIFELFVSTPDPAVVFTDPEIMFSKFRHGVWRTWPTEEQSAIEAFLRQVWEELLGQQPEDGSFTDVESWLCSIGQCEEDLNPYLHKWIEDERLSSCLALSSFLLTSAVARTGTTGRNAFWQGRDAQYAQLQQWAKSNAVVEKMRRAEIRWGGTDIANEFAMARSIAS